VSRSSFAERVCQYRPVNDVSVTTTMKESAPVILSFLLVGCVGMKTMNDYQTGRAPSMTVATSDGCFNIWKHRRGEDSILVRECEGSKFAQAIGEGALLGLSFGLIRTDVGATPKEYILAGKKALGPRCYIINSARLDDGTGGTLGYEMMYDCRSRPD
jgi:hypothetical protein